jgi:hypothetical protein
MVNITELQVLFTIEISLESLSLLLSFGGGTKVELTGFEANGFVISYSGM